MKIAAIWLKFSWNLFLQVQLKYTGIGLDNGLVQKRWQAISWTNDGPVYWCIFALLGLNELKVIQYVKGSNNHFLELVFGPFLLGPDL